MKTEEKIPNAAYPGTLKIDDIKIPCAVLDDANRTRVLSEHGVTSAMRSRSGGSKRSKKIDLEKGRAPLPVFMAPNNLKPFISEELRIGLLNPIKYRTGSRIVHGFPAELLPQICDVWLKAREAGALGAQQERKAQQAEILMRAFAHIGIIALVDEETGFQYDRPRDELNRLLALYLSEERLKWAKMFPDEFYKLIYKLKNWQFPGGQKRTPLIGKITNTIVYEKLPPGVLEKLREFNPKNPQTKRRPATFHQHLSEDIGQPDLRDHLLQIIALLRAASNWRVFERLFARAFPTRAELEEQRQQRLPGVPEPEDEY